MEKLDSVKRNKSIKKHIGLGVIFRVGAIAANLMIIPVTLKLLGQEKFGIWVTLLTIINWVSFFDMGIGNGLRNKVTECLSKGKKSEAKEYISTAYILMGAAVVGASLVYLITSRMVSWDSVFNSKSVGSYDMHILMGIVVVGALINFAVSLCIQLYYSVQRASVGSLGNFISQAGTLLLLACFLKFGTLTIKGVALINMGMLVATNLLLNLTFFREFRGLAPVVKDFKRGKTRSLVMLGGKFFIIQMASVVILTTDNMIITRLLGPEHVSGYNIISKLFSLIIIVHGIVLAPMWSAYTEAYTRKDRNWLIKNRKIMYLFMIPIVIGAAALVVIYPYIIKFWIGEDLDISKKLVILFAVYTVIYTWSNLHMHLLNGLGRVRYQLPVWIFQGAVNIPMSIYFVRVHNMGVNGVILGTTLSLIIFAIMAPVELDVVVNRLIKDE